MYGAFEMSGMHKKNPNSTQPRTQLPKRTTSVSTVNHNINIDSKDIAVNVEIQTYADPKRCERVTAGDDTASTCMYRVGRKTAHQTHGYNSVKS